MGGPTCPIQEADPLFSFPWPGAVPGTAEQGSGNQVESAPAAQHGLRLGLQQPGAFL